MTTATVNTIQIYLPTGEPRGIRIAEITTRIVQAVLIPRSDLAQGKLRKELDLPGIYFLFGEGEDEAKSIVYIGQTEDARKRFDSHNKTKTFWKTAIFCVSKTQNFTQAHIRYLEWYCMQRAKEIARYTLDNGQVPDNSTYVPEPMEAELLDVFETISTLVSTLGYPVFEPLASRGPSSVTFFCRGGGSDGKGELVEDGFVILAGSKARKEVVASATASVTPKREALLAAGVLEERNGDYYFTQDYLYGSPSTAAAVVLGRTANGWVEWKDKNGATLSEVHRDDEAETGDEE
ncbi:GIY-YIG catalytic domain protein [Rubripirellula obstinata]|uniref:GIY-YIG catalytic domain protein n=1 Tax=Rubripirellula obstinata TaxID=406547 RepID=A0A5B1CJF0_9BACT|nr:GIY-YIG nuclease family protein [Rubripirellula obstinata]KAA1260412.1 GIY-YIG catalytic domain protein [Rubripirellula obstinata]